MFKLNDNIVIIDKRYEELQYTNGIIIEVRNTSYIVLLVVDGKKYYSEVKENEIALNPITIQVSEKHNFEGFAPGQPTVYKDITRIVLNSSHDELMIYQGDKCIKVIDNFYYKIEILKDK